MSFNLVSKINGLASDQDELERQISYLTALAPSTLNNLSSIATSLNNDPNFYQTVTNSLNLKADQSTTYTKTQTDQKLTDLIGGAPQELNTLGELSTALNDTSNFGTFVLNSLAGKQSTIVNNPSILSTSSNTLGAFAPSQGRYRINALQSATTWYRLCTISTSPQSQI